MLPVLHVLMLIDDLPVADLLAHELRRTGFDLVVRHATTEAAYLAALETPLDLILADNALLAFDALRALQILRASERDIPLIVVTDASSETAAIECVSLGATDFLFKHQPGRLRSAVIRALDQRDLRAHARAADAALRESEQRFRVLFTHSPDAIILIDPHPPDGSWPIEECNDVACQMNGYTRNELIGQSVDLLNGTVGTPAERVAYLEGLRREGTLHYEAMHRRKDGTRFPVEVRTSLIVVAGRELVLGIDRDITERKRAEAALHESEQRYRTLASNFPNGAVVLFDRDLRFTIADGAGLAELGLSSEQLEGHTFWEIYPPEAAAVNEPIFRAALTGTPSIREVTTGALTLVIHTLPVRDTHGEIIAGMLMSQDITERKRMEAALLEERALLARRVDERTADLSAANAELARTAMLKDEFLSSMSHELRTPLNAVLGLSEALQEEVYGPLNDRQRGSLHSVEASGRHLLALINDILDLAKIGAGKLELALEPASIATICQASLRLITQLAHTKRLSVKLTLDPAVTLLNVDARRLRQILVNLLSNAVKFTPTSGSIGLDVVADPARQVVELTVWDTGIGIAQEQMPRLFQPFVQLDSRLAREYEGTGLGLALVYRMVELHGGSISVTSEVGHGSRFTVALPWPTAAADMHVSAPVEPDVVAIHSTTVRRALVIEDSPTTADQITRYLHELAIESVIVHTGAKVVKLALTEQPDLILLDLLLPDSSGWDVLARLKADSRTRDIPVVIISVFDERARGLALGAAEYLVKPVTRTDVERIVPMLARRDCGGLLLPAMRAPTASLTPPPLVLLAEDNEATITMVVDYLGTHGYHVIVARNGAEAIVRVREAKPAIVLMDIQMPGMDGLEATRRLRSLDALVDLPIIALTALAMPGDRERCLAAGATDYLSKPISLHGLVRLIENHLQRD